MSQPVQDSVLDSSDAGVAGNLNLDTSDEGSRSANESSSDGTQEAATQQSNDGGNEDAEGANESDSNNDADDDESCIQASDSEGDTIEGGDTDDSEEEEEHLNYLRFVSKRDSMFKLKFEQCFQKFPYFA